ncbi:MAG: TetR/AcrR family transcriptional regulator [Spirochaetes bacterium]|nr:TetR/AcrR family transcriptional regulator [Spirochaetota bacterium]
MSTKELLLKNAAHLFIKKGFDETSIDDLTSACKITKGAFYHHFRSKDEIIFEVIQVFLEEVTSWFTIKIMKSQDLKTFLFSYFNYADYFASSRYFHGLTIDTYKSIIDAVKKFPDLKKNLYQSTLGEIPKLIHFIKDSQNNKEIRSDIDPEILAKHIVILSEGVLFFSTVYDDNQELISNGKDIAQHFWDVIKN